MSELSIELNPWPRYYETCHWDGRFLAEDKQNEDWWFGNPTYNFCNETCREKYYDRLGKIIEEEERKKIT